MVTCPTARSSSSATGGRATTTTPRTVVTELANVARETKDLPDAYIAGTNGITPAFLDYALPLVGALPRPGRLAPIDPRGER